MPARKSLTESLSAGESLVCFVTAGDPALDQLPDIIDALNEGGADIIEIGIPFSDPIADGPTIQAASQRALDRRTTPRAIFDVLSAVESAAPLVAMGYANIAMRIGYAEFAESVSKAGISGVILSDLAPDDCTHWRNAAISQGVDTIFLAAPTSTDERLKLVADASTGFIYCVSRTGVTGANSTAAPEVSQTVHRLRRYTDLPICVGFGISKPEHVRMIWDSADGAVVGSFIVDYLDRSWDNGNGRDGLVQLVKRLKAA